VALGLFVLLCVAQLWVTGSGIARYERTLSQGVVYRFESAPVDPEDPFRGRYVRLRFAAEETALPMQESTGHSRKVYAVLGVDDRGFAVFTELLEAAPAEGDYLYVDVQPTWVEKGTVARLSLPFDRYFMEESKAPAAEKAYREATRRGGEADAFVTVRVLDGLGVIEDLYIRGVAVGDTAEGRD
jgi:uncharacterized membrane-anchored protein